eukprot:UN23492
MVQSQFPPIQPQTLLSQQIQIPPLQPTGTPTETTSPASSTTPSSPPGNIKTEKLETTIPISEPTINTNMSLNTIPSLSQRIQQQERQRILEQHTTNSILSDDLNKNAIPPVIITEPIQPETNDTNHRTVNNNQKNGISKTLNNLKNHINHTNGNHTESKNNNNNISEKNNNNVLSRKEKRRKKSSDVLSTLEAKLNNTKEPEDPSKVSATSFTVKLRKKPKIFSGFRSSTLRNKPKRQVSIFTDPSNRMSAQLDLIDAAGDTPTTANNTTTLTTTTPTE